MPSYVTPNKSVYLAGPIRGFSYENATNWRERFSEILAFHNIDAVSPLRFKDYLVGETSLKDYYDKHPLSQAKTLFSRDCMDVLNSDLVFANFLGATTVSIGTVAELGMAHAHRKPVIILMEKGNVHDHVFVNEIASVVASSENEALSLIRSFIGRA